MEQLFSIREFPRAIIHIDADSFFASCEQSLHPELRGVPLVVGKERGIASAVSIEAKRLGVKRSMHIREIRAICPQIIYLPSDYETYSLFSRRMFEIVRRYTTSVEEYSIDECFAEISGLRRPLGKSYEEIARGIKHDLEQELGMTFSIGLGPSKVIAKLGSKWNKPSGLVMIPANTLHTFLKQVAINEVWGIGEQTTKHMQGLGITTAHDFAVKDERWVNTTFTKPHQEIWRELRGEAVLPLSPNEKHTYQSISKAKTFTPPTRDLRYVLAQLSKNTENACIKARRHHLAAQKISFFLRTQDFRHLSCELKLSRPTNIPEEIIMAMESHLREIYDHEILYRQTGVILHDLREDTVHQMDMFGAEIRAEKIRSVYEQLDHLSERYGKHTVFLGSSFQAMRSPTHMNERGDRAERKTDLFKGENARQRIGIPMLGDVG